MDCLARATAAVAGLTALGLGVATPAFSFPPALPSLPVGTALLSAATLPNASLPTASVPPVQAVPQVATPPSADSLSSDGSALQGLDAASPFGGV
jgi:hypothetical protein